METVTRTDPTFGGYLRQYFGNLKQTLKQPRFVIISLLLTILVSEVQFFLAILSAAGKGGGPVAISSLMLYANGGMYGGALGAIGGFFGKMLLMMFLNSFVLGLEAHQNPFGSFFSGIAKSFGAFRFRRLYDPAAWFFGAGSAMLIYYICNITQNRMNSMIGAYLVVMIIGSLGKKNSFLYGLFLHLFFARRASDPRSAQTVTSLMGGSAFGYLAGTALSMAGVGLCPLIGCLLLIPAFLFLTIGLIVHNI